MRLPLPNVGDILRGYVDIARHQQKSRYKNKRWAVPTKISQSCRSLAVVLVNCQLDSILDCERNRKQACEIGLEMSAFNNASKKRQRSDSAEAPETASMLHDDASGASEGSDEDDDDEDDNESKQRVTSRSAATKSSKVTKVVAGQSARTTVTPGGMYTNKQRVLILSSRGITARYRHLMEDMKKLIPHHKKDNKLDTKGDIHVVNEIAELKSCNQVMYFETKKNQDLYMYLGKAPHGPSVKFHVVNVHTMDELKLTGNCMLGSRPLLNFDARFDTEPHLQLLKVVLGDAFGTPRGHPKSKPFVDRVMSFFAVKHSIWIRNYQIVDKSERGSGEDASLVEIGPRMVIIPIRIFSGSLGGATLYQNPTFISPNEQRSQMKKFKGNRFTERVQQKKTRADTLISTKPPVDELAGTRVFKE